ncbi:hypothetical protein GCM10010123_17290 [Pilimelia anulata]|uniref:Protein involved in plasmid replication-relaxation n=1 Tax=Pilimelia anulata TaxID=53371 RepID=A0A8J3B8R0_9ACTN|nr:replication-relaxation family protein [Pilimelia anulata]GGJ88214.1 hypothetical protein GCM10010123_17290 [Pilimelia anulata]
MAATDHVLTIQSRLTGRDLQLLEWLADHGVLTSDQIARGLFPSLDAAQRRLQTLHHARVLGRFRPQRWEGGSYPYHYVLDQLGVDVVAAQRGDPVPRRTAARQRRWHLTQRANLDHKLGVNGFFADLAGYARTRPGAALLQWRHAGFFQGEGAFREPGDSPFKSLLRAKVRPDAAGVFAEDGRRVRFWFEYDTGSESLTVLVDKMHLYSDMANDFERVRPVLFSLGTSAREGNLHQRLREAGITHPAATLARDSLPAGLCAADAVWWATQGDPARRRLIDLDRFVLDRHTNRDL